MPMTIQTTFKGLPRSAEAERLIRERAQGFEKFFQRITSCRVTVTSLRKKGPGGIAYSVRVDLVVPRGQILATKDHRARPEDHDLDRAVERAFGAARRQLEDYARRVRGDVKPRYPEGPARRAASAARARTARAARVRPAKTVHARVTSRTKKEPA